MSFLSHFQVIDYINVDFRDGTGPAAVAPNEVARAFRDAEILTQAGRSGRHFWSALTNEDDSGNRGLSKFLPGARGLEWRGPGHGDAKRGNRRRKRVVHVESATTGTFFKVYNLFWRGGWVLGKRLLWNITVYFC